MSNAQFMNFEDAGVKTGNGFVLVPVFEKEILDMVGKRGEMLKRIKARPATGNPTRYFEKQPSEKSAAFQDPHNLKANKFNVKRVAKSAFVKAITNEIEFTHFDREVGIQQGLYRGLTTEDVQDMVNDLLTLQDEKLWTGNDTSLSESTTNEYVGLLTQLTQKGVVADGVLMTDAIRTEIARLSDKKDYDAKPSVIVVNPITYDLIEQEEQARPTNHKHYEVTLTAGIKVMGVMTAMGVLPIIADPYLPLDTTTSVGSTIHRIAILSENLLTRFYVGSDKPRIFAFGIQDESLNEKYMALQYDCIVAKGAEYAHTILTKTVKNA